MKSRRRSPRTLTKAELRAMGVVPGLVVTRYAPDGQRATVEQLTAEASAAGPPLFKARRLTDNRQASEGGAS
jgi:hypothetical protein